MRTNTEAEDYGLDPVELVKAQPPPSNLLLTVPRRYFCCGSSLLFLCLFACDMLAMRANLLLPSLLPVLFSIKNRK